MTDRELAQHLAQSISDAITELGFCEVCNAERILDRAYDFAKENDLL